MKTIPLTQGKVALVDDEDYEALAKYKWCAQAARDGRRWYAVRNVRREGHRTMVYMHREILGEAALGRDIDHLNGNGCDNQRVNLHAGACSENLRNSHKHRAGRRPGTIYLADYHRKRPWQARIWIDGRLRYLGMFATEQEAHERFLQVDVIKKALEQRLIEHEQERAEERARVRSHDYIEYRGACQ